MRADISGYTDNDGLVYSQILNGSKMVAITFSESAPEEYVHGVINGEFELSDVVDILETLRDLFGVETFMDAMDEVLQRMQDNDNKGDEDNMTQTYNRVDAAYAQEEYCNEQEIPMFAPRDGQCWCCGKDIYGVSLDGSVRGYSVEYASSHHITHCPFCNMAFDD